MSSIQPFHLFNTLNGKKEKLEAIDPKHLKIYACGPTVYNYAHIGNARMAVVFDTLVRTLKVIYPKVTYVSNITDIDDKIIEAANDQNLAILAYKLYIPFVCFELGAKGVTGVEIICI